MADFPTLVTAIYGILIIGAGYIGVWFKYFLKYGDINRFYRELPQYDKAVQSLILGTISILVTSFFSKINWVIMDTESLLTFILSADGAFFIFLDFFIAMIIARIWIEF